MVFGAAHAWLVSKHKKYAGKFVFFCAALTHARGGWEDSARWVPSARKRWLAKLKLEN